MWRYVYGGGWVAFCCGGSVCVWTGEVTQIVACACEADHSSWLQQTTRLCDGGAFVVPWAVTATAAAAAVFNNTNRCCATVCFTDRATAEATPPPPCQSSQRHLAPTAAAQRYAGDRKEKYCSHVCMWESLSDATSTCCPFCYPTSA